LEPIPPPKNAFTAIIQNKCSRKLATKCVSKISHNRRERERGRDREKEDRTTCENNENKTLTS
jgi:hypothetical protein